jgi:hypothetical protein
MTMVQLNAWLPGNSHPIPFTLKSSLSLRFFLDTIYQKNDDFNDQLFYESSSDKTLHIYIPEMYTPEMPNPYEDDEQN